MRGGGGGCACWAGLRREASSGWQLAEFQLGCLGLQPSGSQLTGPATSPPPCPQFVEDPYTKARFQPECEGQVSPVGDVARIGLEASGLVSFPGQQR